MFDYIIHLYGEAVWSREKCLKSWTVYEWSEYHTACGLMSHSEDLSLLLPLDKTSYSTMSNPEVNVILLTSKLNWGCGRLTLFYLALEHPALVCSKSYVSDGQERCVCVSGGEGRAGQVRTKTVCSSKYCMASNHQINVWVHFHTVNTAWMMTFAQSQHIHELCCCKISNLKDKHGLWVNSCIKKAIVSQPALDSQMLDFPIRSWTHHRKRHF